jgi:hypothetical protein
MRCEISGTSEGVFMERDGVMCKQQPDGSYLPYQRPVLKKLFISPHFMGPLPNWIEKYWENVAPLAAYGFDWFVPTDAADFRARCKRYLGVTMPECFADPRKYSEAQPALAEIYPDVVAGYDFWGYTNLDVVYGRLDRWVTDDLLSTCDVFGNDPNSMCGPFSLLRNNAKVNALYRNVPNWQEIFESPNFHGFDEGLFAQAVRESDVGQQYRFWQGFDTFTEPKLRLAADGTLFDDHQGGAEIMMYHFRRTKRWPL